MDFFDVVTTQRAMRRLEPRPIPDAVLRQIMETALTRQPPRKQGDHPIFLPEQRLTREECIKGYTVNAARTAWREASTGSLSIGKYADLIVLDRDILTCNVYDIGDTEVLLTLLGGKEVHRSKSFAH